MKPQNVSDSVWTYCLGEMNEPDASEFAARLAREPDLARDVEACKTLLLRLATWQNEPMPTWDPGRMADRPRYRPLWQWLTTAFAAGALLISLLPHFHLSATGLEFRWSAAGISASQLEARLDQFDSRHNLVLEQRIAELSEDQALKNRQLVVSLLTVAEQRRRNDLIQMASWFSRQKELSNRQQRQILHWVADAQEQDNARINALWSTMSSQQETYP